MHHAMANPFEVDTADSAGHLGGAEAGQLFLKGAIMGVVHVLTGECCSAACRAAA